ncbi:MAG: type I glyceraldehyde-3-phosphate dehydrogenase, partial [Bacteroidales bacterium]|nr:type I glyceraldehyde-3-phosphate dehydrogenase [Bacteroidales bacterium]
MAKIRIAINGFGRIGRVTFRKILERNNMEVVAINDITDSANLAHLLKYDSVQGSFNGKVEHNGNHIIVNSKKVIVLNETDPAKLPWKKLNIDVVIEATGEFTDRESAIKHVEQSG